MSQSVYSLKESLEDKILREFHFNAPEINKEVHGQLPTNTSKAKIFIQQPLENENSFLTENDIYVEVEGESGKSLSLEKDQQNNLVGIVKFCIAFTKIKSLPNFNLALSYIQIEKNSIKFDKCINQEDWIEAFVDAYNYKLVTKGKHGHKRISIRKEGF